MTLTVGSLFSGIGGIDLGLERAGMRVIWQAETDPYASKVLAKHWPTVPNLGDVTTIDWSSVECPDLVCGGYPCQPFSQAGRRGGTSDARHLWPYFAAALRVLRPRWALLENVPGHLSLGFADVLADLAALGFDAEWDLLPAAAVGAPHLRYRLFVVAHTQGVGNPQQSEGADTEALLGAGARTGRRGGSGDPAAGVQVMGRDAATGQAHVADTDGTAWDAQRSTSQAVFGPETLERPRRRGGSIGHHWATEPSMGRVAHGVPSRVDRLRCLGNAVVPQVAEYVGRRIMEAHDV